MPRRLIPRGVLRALRRMFARAARRVLRLPPLRDHVIPWLLSETVGVQEASPEALAVHDALSALRGPGPPILVGPWVSEVGFELLYWIPFLQWAVERYGLDRERLVFVSRGGTRRWYGVSTDRYLEVFDLLSLPEYNEANRARWRQEGHQKQLDRTLLDELILERAQERIGDADNLHPSLMYRLFKPFWDDKAAFRLLQSHTVWRRIDPDATPYTALPETYAAVRFYFSDGFPDTPDNRAFVSGLVRDLAQRMPVVLLHHGFQVDEHEDFLPQGEGIVRLNAPMTAGDNLEVQTRFIEGASVFVGTYGGLSYLAPLLGVPSVSFYSEDGLLLDNHVEVARRAFRRMGTPYLALHVREAALLRHLLARDEESISGELNWR